MIIYANYFEFSGLEKALHISDNIYYHLIGSASQSAAITIANVCEALILIHGRDLDLILTTLVPGYCYCLAERN